MAELPVSKRIFYGMAGLTMSLPDFMVMQWLLVRYVPPDGPHLVPAALFGAFMLVGRVVDGTCCVMVAHLSDGCQSRWGRRLPFMRFAIVPLAVVFFLMFTPPIGQVHWLNALYIVLLLPIYFILYASCVTPYLALMPEITSDLKERVDLMTFQSLFVMAGTFTFAAMGMILQRGDWIAVGGVASTLLLLFYLPVATQIHEKQRANQPEHTKLGFFESFALTLRNRAFRYVVASTSIYWFALNGLIALVPHWTLNVLGRSEGDVTLLMVPFLLMNLVFFFVFNYLARKFGKYAIMQVTFLGSCVPLFILCFVGRLPFGDSFIQTAVVMALFGAPVAGFMVLPFAVLSDVVDYDEQLTGRRREAIFFGVQGVFQKTMIGVSAFVFTIVPFIGSDGTLPLRPDRPLTFEGDYTPIDSQTPIPKTQTPELDPGTIRIEVSPADLDAPWILQGPGGFNREGTGSATLTGMSPGPYKITWQEVPGYTPPKLRNVPTPYGLKLMTFICGLACIVAFLVFLKYPIRERDGKIVLVR